MINKYDVPLEFNSVNPITAILSYISPGMEILEMGPATGRLTRYLSEEMGCRVSIVEIDSPSFKKAMQFAADGICANLDENDWYEYYLKKRFDAIIFADVIEHLNKQIEVIKKAKSLLKDDGKLLFSIPNIAHSGIISQLINNRFQYTETGILDDTHVKFYTYYSFHQLLEECGLFVFSEKAIHQDVNIGDWSDFKCLDEVTQKILHNREFSDVFEYVFAAVTNDWYQEHKNELIIERISAFKGTTAVSTLYYDCGEGFKPQGYLQSNMFIDPDGRFSVVFSLSGIENIKQLRFDPCDYECKIRLLSVNGRLPNYFSALNNYIIKNETIYFLTKDPNFLIIDAELMSASRLEITGEIKKLNNDELIKIIEENKITFDEKILQEHEQVEKLNLLYEQVRKELDSLNNLLTTKSEEAASLKEALNRKTEEAASLKEALNRKTEEAASLKEALNRKTEEATSLKEALIKKTKETTSLNESLIAKTAEAHEAKLQLITAQKDLGNMSATLEKISIVYNSISNSTCWKLTKPIRAMLDGVKFILSSIIGKARRITALLGKTMRYIKHFGFRATVKKIESKMFRHKKIKIKSFIPMQYDFFNEYSDTVETGKSVSVVIPTKNGGEEFELLLKNLKNQRGFAEIEIVVVDSGSTDNTVEVARKYGAKVIQIKPEEFSHSYSRNLGVENATKEYLCIMTQDALPTSEYWLYHLYQTINNDPEIAAVSSAEYSRMDSDLYYRAFAWNHYKYLGVLNGDTIMSMPDNNDPELIRQNGQLSDVTCFIKRDILQKYRYRGSFAEDLDLGMRLISDGYKLAFLGNEVAIHSHNRGSFYYLKRRFVELVTLKNIFPDQPILDYRYKQVLKETIFLYYYVTKLLEKWQTKDVFNPFTVFREEFLKQYRSLRKNYFPLGKMLESLNIFDKVDEQTCQFLVEIIKQYNKIVTLADERYSGVMIDAMEGYLNVVFDFMSECYEVVDNEIVDEFVECVYKLLTSVAGTFFAYSYLSNEDDRNEYIDFYNLIGEGV